MISSQALCIEFIAHRGLSSEYPENSLRAVSAAMAYNFKYIEIDVQLTKDQKVVSFHDTTIDRLTDSSGKVSDFTLLELKQMSQDINSLEEILMALESSDKVLIIEVKNTNNKYPGIEKRIVELVRKYDMKNIIYKSFTKDVLRRFSLLDNKELIYVTIGEISWLNFYIDDWLRFGSLLDFTLPDYYQIHRKLINKGIVNKIHKMNKRVIAWDIQDKASFQKAESLQVDIVETDYPPASLTQNPKASR